MTEAAVSEPRAALTSPVTAATQAFVADHLARRIAPGLGEIIGVRLPLMEAAHKAFKRGTRHGPSSPLLDVVGRLIGNRYGDIRWFGMWNLERLLPTDPERTWQLMRRAAREAGLDLTLVPPAPGQAVVREEDVKAFLDKRRGS